MNKPTSPNKTIPNISLLVLILLWMIFIFHLSAQPAAVSKELSGGVVKTVISIASTIAPEKAAEIDTTILHNIIRKSAHFSAYMVLGALILFALRRRLKNGKNVFILTIVISMLYAASDEFHQLFVVGRSCELRDVLIDSTGALFGCLIVMMLSRLSMEIKRTPNF